jgi:hypothetical protein
MPKVLEPGQPYTGRAEGVHPISVTIDKDAYTVLKRYAPTSKAHGHFLSRLLYEFAARRDVTERVSKALGEDSRGES